MQPPDPQLRDEVVALRPWRDEDVAEKFRLFSDAEILRFSWGEVDAYTEADAWAKHVANTRAWKEGTGAEFACTDPADDHAIIGGASIYDIEAAAGRASAGYWVAAHARGRGVATRAVLLLARWAFEDLQIARLQITCGPDNAASQRVATKAGFTREAVFRSHLPFKGGRRDTVVFSLLPEDQKSRR